MLNKAIQTQLEKEVASLNLDKRKLQILKAVVDAYIRTGEPVGSKTIRSDSDLNVSSATIRNDMAALEKMGYLIQPHTSAGRIPSYLGYRLYIDKLMSPQVLSPQQMEEIDERLKKGDTMETLIDNAADVLSDITGLTVVNKSNLMNFSVITKVEVIPAGKRLYALLMITSTGSAKNKLCRLKIDLNEEQLAFFSDFLSKNLVGVNIDELTPAMLQNLAIALGSYMITLSPLLYTVYQLGEEFGREQVHVRGEQNLLAHKGINTEEMVQFIHSRQELDQLLTGAFGGIRVLFGKEGDSFAVSNSSMIVTPYKIGEQTGGSFGILGPLRLDYAKMIPYVEYFSNALTKQLGEVMKDEEESER